MRLLITSLALSPLVCFAQGSFPTAFPDGALPLEPAVLQQKLTGKVVNLTYANGVKVRVEYKTDYAFVNTANASDNGKWHVEGSAMCFDWKRFPPGCSEVRSVGDALFLKRVTNGEIVQMHFQ